MSGCGLSHSQHCLVSQAHGDRPQARHPRLPQLVSATTELSLAPKLTKLTNVLSSHDHQNNQPFSFNVVCLLKAMACFAIETGAVRCVVPCGS